MTNFLDLLEAFHHWCVSGDRTRLEHGQAWIETVVAMPRDETGWHQLGVRASEPSRSTRSTISTPTGQVRWQRRCRRPQPPRLSPPRVGTFQCTGV
jgi:hypothetical protein